jgi:hypothetical protein
LMFHRTLLCCAWRMLIKHNSPSPNIENGH